MNSHLYLLVCIITSFVMDGSASLKTPSRSGACGDRPARTKAALGALKLAGARFEKLQLRVEEHPSWCNIGLETSTPVKRDDELIFVPQSLLLQPFQPTSPQPGDDPVEVEMRELRAQLFDLYDTCNAKTALAVVVLHERRHSCVWNTSWEAEAHVTKKGFTGCSLWPWLLPDTYTSGLTFPAPLVALLNGSSARGPIMSLYTEIDDVRKCVSRMKFKEGRAPTEDEMLWGFHSMRSRSSGTDKFHALMNPVLNLLNYHPNLSLANIFSDSEDVLQDSRGDLVVVRGDIMSARFDMASGEELYYRYGDYSNAQLLVSYGFVVPSSLAKESGMIGLQTHIKLTDVFPLPLLSNSTNDDGESPLRSLFQRFSCSKYQLVALEIDSNLIHQKYSSWFPACARLHYFLVTGGTDASSALSLIEQADGIKDPHLHDWPPLEKETADERSVGPWERAAEHAKKLLMTICRQELQRLEDAFVVAGLKQPNVDSLAWDVFSNTVVVDSAILQFVRQVVEDERAIWGKCITQHGGSVAISLQEL